MKEKKKILASLGIGAVLFSSIIGGATLAKYLSKVNVKGTAEVASWVFKVNGTESQTQEISLANTYDEATLINNKIAPGTTGNFGITIDTTGSDVGVQYKVEFNGEDGKPNNLYFTYNNTKYTTLEELGDAVTGTIDAGSTEEIEIPITWTWDYETDKTTDENEDGILDTDYTDTQDGKAAGNYTFNVTVTGTQVEPV